MYIIVITILSIAVTLYVTYPLFLSAAFEHNKEQYATNNNVQRKKLNLTAEKDNLLSEIKDIEFDYKLGKITEEDYEYLTDRYKKSAASIIEEIRRLNNLGK